jgi:hypothetical protein
VNGAAATAIGSSLAGGGNTTRMIEAAGIDRLPAVP